jgi:hypothetical protein
MPRTGTSSVPIAASDAPGLEALEEVAAGDDEAPGGAGMSGIRTIDVSMSVMLCAVSFWSDARSAAVHCGPPRILITLSGPKRADAGLAGIRGGALTTSPEALSAFAAAFWSDASSTWMQDAAKTQPSITAARILNRSADAVMAEGMANLVP